MLKKIYNNNNFIFILKNLYYINITNIKMLPS